MDPKDLIDVRNNNFRTINDILSKFMECKKNFKQNIISSAEANNFIGLFLYQLKKISQDTLVVDKEMIDQICKLSENIIFFEKEVKGSEIHYADF